MLRRRSFVCLAWVPLVSNCLLAQEPPVLPRREALERASRELAAQQAAATPTAQSPSGPPSGGLGTQSGPIRLIDVSLNLLAAVGTSTERDDVLGDLQGGAHDPKKRGFTLQQAELSLSGAVDRLFKAEAHLVTAIDPNEGETIVELEEAFLTTTQLPAGLQIKAGLFFTEFGRINAQHPHAWDWQNQPVINTRLFGGDGMRGPGARVAWLAPTDQFAELTLGVHNANGEQMTSFLANEEVYGERPIGGRFFTERQVRSGSDMVYTARASTAVELSDTQGIGLGASAVFGPNPTGGEADTMIYGADFVWRWKPVANDRGYPFVKVQGEVMARGFDAAEQVDSADPLNSVTLPGERLQDYGGYLQGLYGFTPGWAVGMRIDWASGSGDSYDAGTQSFGRDQDVYRTDRLRLSPMLAWKPSEFSRIRLQYDYDDSDHLEGAAHSVWLGFEVLIGSHPPHAY